MNGSSEPLPSSLTGSRAGCGRGCAGLRGRRLVRRRRCGGRRRGRGGRGRGGQGQPHARGVTGGALHGRAGGAIAVQGRDDRDPARGDRLAGARLDREPAALVARRTVFVPGTVPDGQGHAPDRLAAGVADLAGHPVHLRRWLVPTGLRRARAGLRRARGGLRRARAVNIDHLEVEAVLPVEPHADGDVETADLARVDLGRDKGGLEVLALAGFEVRLHPAAGGALQAATDHHDGRFGPASVVRDTELNANLVAGLHVLRRHAQDADGCRGARHGCRGHRERPPASAINAAARAHRARKRVGTSYHPLHGRHHRPMTPRDTMPCRDGCATRGPGHVP